MEKRRRESAFTESLADFAVNLASIGDLNLCCDFVTARAVVLLGADEGAIYLETRPLFGADAPQRLTAPLQTQGETLGILAVTRRSPSATFDQDDERRLGLLANIAAVALAGIKRARVIRQQADWRDRALDLLQETGQVINSTLELAPLLRRIINSAARVLHAEAGMLALLDDGGYLVLRAVAGDVPADLVGVLLKSEQSLIAWVTRHGRAALVPDPGADPRTSLGHPASEAGFVARALLAAPLATKGHTIGAIELSNKKVGAFDRGDQRLLEALALSAAAAIENARLYERIQRQALQQENMIRVGQAMSSAGDVDTVLQQIVESALAAIPAAFTAAVHLADQEQEMLSLHCYAGRPLWDTMKEPFPLPQGVAGHVFVTRQVANVGNVLDDPRYISGPGRVVYHSMLVSPLIVYDKPLGTLSVNGLEPHAFGYDDEQMIRGLAAQAAVALRNASLLDSLRESEARYRGLVENSNALLITTDTSGVITFAGGRWAAMTGYETDEVIGRPYQDMVHPQDWPDLLEHVAQLQTSPSKVSDLRYRVTHRDGGVRWHQSSAISVGDASGQVEHIYAAIHDVTARVQAEQAVARQAEQLSALNAIASSISCSLDPDDIVRDGLRKLMALLRLDAAALGLLDPGQNRIAPHTVIGFSPEFLEFVTAQQKDGHIPPVSDRKTFIIPDLTTHTPFAGSSGLSLMIQREGMRTLASVPVVAQDEAIGVLLIAACAPSAISASDLELLATVGQQFGVALHNAQVYAQAEDRAVHLEVANHRLRDLARRKSQFIQNTSHELRTPLTFVRGYAEILLGGNPGPLSDEQRRMLEIMYAKSRTLVDLVNDIASLMDIELGPDDVSQINLLTLLQHSVHVHQEQAEQAGVALETEWPDEPLIIRGNQDRLLQTFHHLLDNAIKFSPDGGCVRTRVWTQERNVFIEMSDQGVGIPPGQHEFIFDRFYQVDGSAVRRFGGTGLGLAIVKETIQAHGGMIQIQSDGIPGEGSAFTIILPLPRR